MQLVGAKKTIAGIILAGGKGKRMNSIKENKVTHLFLGRPMIIYAVELFQDIVDVIVVVVGAYADSVKKALKNYQQVFAYQKKPLGTAHAAKVGLQSLGKYRSSIVLIGYGDHMMFYKKETVRAMIDLHKRQKAALTLITCCFDNPDKLAWGRIIRDNRGFIVDSIEHKDANLQQRKIKELNAGFYCFDFNFLKKNINKVKKSVISGEYYLNALVKIAATQNKKVVGLPVRFEEAGLGINTKEELKKSEELYRSSIKE